MRSCHFDFEERRMHAERLSFVFDFEKREYARANFIIYFDISVILSVVVFCVTFLIYFIFFLQIPNTTKTHTSHSHLFLFLLCYLVSSFFVFYTYLNLSRISIQDFSLK